jgi:hypothetical protein
MRNNEKQRETTRNVVRPERFELLTYCSGGCLYTVALREINEL